MKKEISYIIKREIEYLPVINDFYVYKETETIGNNEPIIREGITINVIDDIKQEESIPFSEYQLYQKDILEFARQNLFGDQKTYEKFKECCIRNPFTYFKENGLKNVELLFVREYDHSIRDINNKKLPVAIYFDYIEAHMHNGMYNLKEVLEILKKRNDIKFLQNGIVPVPYYNRDEEQSEYLEFIWIPSNEDFDKIADCKDSWDRYNKIKTEIFGLKEKSEENKNKKYKLKR